MADRLSVCNDALVLLGQTPLTEFLEANDRALLVSTIYDRVRDGVIRAHTWDCCIKRVVLSPSTDAPEFEWSNKFRIPADCLRIISISLCDTDPPYTVEGDYILCNESAVYLRYLYRREDGWDAGLTESLVYSMAAALAYPLTLAADKAQFMEQKAAEVIRKARFSDSQQGTSDTIYDSALLRARRG